MAKAKRTSERRASAPPAAGSGSLLGAWLASWLRAARPLAHANIAPPLLLGQALAYSLTGRFSWEAALVAHLFGLLDHLFIVFANDYADREIDATNETYNLYSGGSRVIQEGRLSAAAIRRAAQVSLGLLLALSAAGAYLLDRPYLPALAALAALLLWAYSYPPLRLSYRGFGELLQGLGVGVVLPAVGYYLQTGALVRLPWWSLAGPFLLAYAGNIVTALPDAPSDAAGGKRSWPVARGEKRARWDAVILLAVGLGLFFLLDPGLSDAHKALAIGPSVALLLLSLTLIKKADAENKGTCTRFVTLLGGAIVSALVIFSALHFLRPVFSQALLGPG